MGYRVLPYGKKKEKWRVIFEAWKDGDRKDTSIPQDQLLQHGFSPLASIGEAKVLAKAINARVRLEKDSEKKKVQTLSNLKRQEIIDSAYLPEAFCREFTERLLKDAGYGDKNGRKTKKTESRWKCAQKIIAQAKIEVSSWHEKRRDFYRIFAQKKMSLEYVRAVTRLLNEWGHFYSEKNGSYFRPLPNPTGHDASVIEDAYLESGKRLKTSLPITAEKLEQAKHHFKEEQYRWLKISIEFGLRPSEVDGTQLRKPDGSPKNWYVTKDENGTEILHVYQEKLKNILSKKRWKLIPVLFDGQKTALKIIREGLPLARPLPKTTQKYLGDGVKLYAGRKNFVDRFLDEGERIENVSAWMGHSSITTTERYYRDKQQVRYTLTSR